VLSDGMDFVFSKFAEVQAVLECQHFVPPSQADTERKKCLGEVNASAMRMQNINLSSY
jgi:hypothetical protein